VLEQVDGRASAFKTVDCVFTGDFAGSAVDGLDLTRRSRGLGRTSRTAAPAIADAIDFLRQQTFSRFETEPSGLERDLFGSANAENNRTPTAA
jgi:hypothetical protein